MTCKRDRIRFDQHEKNFTSEALVEALKKLKTFYHFFKTLRLFSRLCANPVQEFLLKTISSVHTI